MDKRPDGTITLLEQDNEDLDAVKDIIGFMGAKMQVRKARFVPALHA